VRVAVLSLCLLAHHAFADDPDLPRVGTFGALPAEAVELTVRVDGSLILDGKSLALPALRATLREARRTQDRDGGPDVLLRVDARLPWKALAWVLGSCAESGIRRVWYAVRPETGEDVGAFALFLATSREEGRGAEDVGSVMETECTVSFDDTGCEPAALYRALQGMKAALGSVPIEMALKPSEQVPAGFVLSLADMAVRAGAEWIHFPGLEAPPEGAELTALVRELTAGSSQRTPSVRLDASSLRDGRGRVPEARPQEGPAGLFRVKLPPRKTEVEEDDAWQEPAGPEPVEPLPRAMRWLARHQDRKSGSWGSAGDTGLALMVFLAAGHTDRGNPSSNPYARTIRKGLQWLMQVQADDGRFDEDAHGHAVACAALWLAARVTSNPEYAAPALSGTVSIYTRREHAGRGTLLWYVIADRMRWSGYAMHRLESPHDAAGKRFIASIRDSLDGNEREIARVMGVHDWDPSYSEKNIRIAMTNLDAQGRYFATALARRSGGRNWEQCSRMLDREVLAQQQEDGGWGSAWDTAAHALCLEIASGYERATPLAGYY